jgi:hypothetical protein
VEAGRGRRGQLRPTRRQHLAVVAPGGHRTGRWGTDLRGGSGQTPGEAAPSGWSTRRWRAGRGGGVGGRASKEAATTVCAQDLAVRENGASVIEKLKKELGGFQTRLYSSVRPRHR